LPVHFAGLAAGIGRISAGDYRQEIEVHGKDELSPIGEGVQLHDGGSSDRAREPPGSAGRGARHRCRPEGARARELERRTETIDRLGQMANRLPGCTNEREFVVVVGLYVPQIFPACPGRSTHVELAESALPESPTGTTRPEAPPTSRRANRWACVAAKPT